MNLSLQAGSNVTLEDGVAGTGGHGFVVLCMFVLLAYPSTLACVPNYFRKVGHAKFI